MTVREDKQFSKEDLDLVKDDSSVDDGGKAAGDAQSGRSGEDVATKTDDKVSGEEGRAADAPKKLEKSRDSVFDDADDDDGDDVEKEDAAVEKSDKTNDGAEKDDKKTDSDEKDLKKDEPKKDDQADWRDAFISRVLKGKENELTAAKLDKRREALKKRLARYKTVEDYMLAGLAAQERISSGEYRKAKLAADASDEEITEWRKENGIPEKPDGYEIPKIAGHKWTEEDTPFIDSFKRVAHDANIDQEQLNRFTAWYARNLADQQDTWLEKLAQQDRQDVEALEDELRSELGSEFRPTSKLVQRFLKDSERGVGEFVKEMREARYPDENGNYRRFINHPKLTKFLVGLALETYGDAALIEGDGKGTASNRLKEIEKIRDTDINTYWRQGLDKEYTELVEKQNSANRRRRSA